MDQDRRAALSAAALSAAVFLPTALLCGLTLDDYGFFGALEGADEPARSLGRLSAALAEDRF